MKLATDLQQPVLSHASGCRSSESICGIRADDHGRANSASEGVVWLLKAERDRLTRQIQGISAALSALGVDYGKPTGVRRKLSAGRARIADAQRQR
jgi:hypothetical protein